MHIKYIYIIIFFSIFIYFRYIYIYGNQAVCGTSEQTLNFAPGFVILNYIIARGCRPVFDAAVNEDRH